MSFVFTWLVLAAFWISLSGFFDPIHLTFGALSVTLVSWMSHRHLVRGAPVGRILGRTVRVLAYAPWLIWQIILANVEVIACVLGLKPIAPQVIRVPRDVQSQFGLVLLANSITLTPGTVTVDLEGDDQMVIHALTTSAASGVQSGEMAKRVRKVEGAA